MDQFNKKQEWQQIRSALKDKFTSHSNEARRGLEAQDNWQKYQQITGKSKEEIINILHKVR